MKENEPGWYGFPRRDERDEMKELHTRFNMHLYALSYT